MNAAEADRDTHPFGGTKPEQGESYNASAIGKNEQSPNISQRKAKVAFAGGRCYGAGMERLRLVFAAISAAALAAIAALLIMIRGDLERLGDKVDSAGEAGERARLRDLGGGNAAAGPDPYLMEDLNQIGSYHFDKTDHTP